MNDTRMEYSTFGYLYRDGGNFKSWGMLLLSGAADEADKRILISCLDSGLWFSAEKLGIPVLYEGLTKFGPSSLDHTWHEFDDLRPATQSEIESNVCFGTLAAFLKSFLNGQRLACHDGCSV